MSVPQPTRDRLLAIARTLPAAPQVLASVCELLQDINADLDVIAREIRMDSALAARVIRVSNSPGYGGRGNVASVDEAVGRVGFSAVVRLVGTATVAGLADRDLRCYHVPLDLLREALLLHALASESIAEVAGLDPRAAYVAGLLRGVGMMVLDRHARDSLPTAEMYDPTTFATYRDWELIRFGLDATAVTTMAMDEWKLPPEIVTAIQHQFDPPVVSDGAATLTSAVNLAGAIAVDHGLALPGDVLHWTRTPEKLAAAALDEGQFTQASERAGTRFAQQRQGLY